LLNQVFYLLRSEAGQYYLGHPGRLNLSNWVFLNIALPVKQVAECPNGSIVGILSIAAIETT